MQFFSHDGFDLAFLDRQPASGEGDPVLMIHGFASSHYVNWVSPGWFKTLNDAGFRAIAFDNRGHGSSSKSYEEADYTPVKMASDAAALLGHLGIERAHVMGYSMGARICAFIALKHPDLVRKLVMGGLGARLVEGVGLPESIADALLAPSREDVTDPTGQMFRNFAEQTKSDRRALAACIRGSRQTLTREEVATIRTPTLIGVGTKDDVAGSPHELAAMMPNAKGLDIPGRDHMLSVGDKVFKAAVLQFLDNEP